MNKRTVLILALVVALALPSAALAKAEFSLGGFIKLDAFWGSTQTGKNMNGSINRNNDPNFHHGRLKFTAQGSRFNFTIKGPKLFGATTTGFIEIDFDPAEEGIGNVARTASNSYSLRLRHAMFRLNWPETELLFGQYWSTLCEFWPELAQDGPFQLDGIPTARLPQIRLTQKFLGAWMATVLIGEANSVAGDRSYSGVDRNGAESAETPQVQARIRFSKDFYGKAAYYGKPTPFTAQIAGAWQRNVTGERAFVGGFQGQDNFATAVVTTRQQYVDPWIIMGTLFIPVIPTHSANLAGTASLMTQWWIGQGVEAFGFSGIASNLYRFSGVGNNLGLAAVNVFDFELQSRFGGYVQAQYYFTNQWYLTFAYAMSKAFDVGRNDISGAAVGATPDARTVALLADTANYHHEFDLCLWYRPVTAVKFALQYAYQRTNWFQITSVGSTRTNFGDGHRVEFVGLFFF